MSKEKPLRGPFFVDTEAINPSLQLRIFGESSRLVLCFLNPELELRKKKVEQLSTIAEAINEALENTQWACTLCSWVGDRKDCSHVMFRGVNWERCPSCNSIVIPKYGSGGL